MGLLLVPALKINNPFEKFSPSVVCIPRRIMRGSDRETVNEIVLEECCRVDSIC